MQTSLFLFALVIVVICATTPAFAFHDGDTSHCHLKKLTDYPEAKCIDGSPAAYYVCPGKRNDKVMFHMEGGGLCPTPETCLMRSRGGLGSSKSYPPRVSAAKKLHGFLSRDCLVNPHFCEFAVIFLMYCDGNLYSSQLEQPITFNGTQLFQRGDFIRKAALKSAAKLFNAFKVTEVIYGGGSAGALATFLHSDDDIPWLRSLVPTLGKIGAAPQSGFFPIAPNVLGEHVVAPMVRHMFNWTNSTGSFSKKCLAALPPQDAWKCGYAQFSFNFSTVPTFVLQSKTDKWQVECDLLGMPGPEKFTETCDGAPGYHSTHCPFLDTKSPDGFPFSNCSLTQMTPILKYQYVTLDLVNTTRGFSRPNNGMFLTSCLTHVAAIQTTYWTGVTIRGVRMNEATWSWWHNLRGGDADDRVVPLEDNPYVWMDCVRKSTDPNFNCNPSCNQRLHRSHHLHGPR